MIIKAGEEHKEWIIRHRVEMFRWMGRDDGDLTIIEKVTRDFLDSSWDKAPTAYLSIEDDSIQGGCSIAFYTILPSRKNPSGKNAYILNLFVEPEYRKQGVATRLLTHIIKICKENGVGRVSLHATPMGFEVYKSIGFELVDNFYRLRLE